jgi:predicted nucleotidyltransferase
MINTSELEKIKDQELRNHLEIFIENIKTICGSNIKSIVLYGGVAKGDYTKGKSNTNILFVFEQIDLDILDALSISFQKAIADFHFSPFLLTTSEIEPVRKVFAVKLFDIQQHHILLYGEDVLSSLEISKEDLRFISEQELRNQLSRMKFFYIQNFNLPERLVDRIQKSFTTLLVNANTYLYLKSGTYYTTRDEIITHLINEPNIDKVVLNDLSLLRQGKIQPDKEKTRNLYGQLMLQYKYIIKDLEKL